MNGVIVRRSCQNLQRDIAPQLEVVGAKDDAHPTGA